MKLDTFMPTSICPDRNTLEKLLLGKLPAAKQTSPSLHLENCRICTDVAGTLSLSDELTDAITMRKPLQVDEEVLSRAIERGKQLSSQLQAVQPDVTAIGHQPDEATYIPDSEGPWRGRHGDGVSGRRPQPEMTDRPESYETVGRGDSIG